MSFLSSREQVAPRGIGKPVRRSEDARLLTGAGRFADDVSLPGQAYAYLLRSPYAHARITRIDVAAAEDAQGVLAVLTGSDADRDGLQPIPHRPVPANPHEVPLKSRDGSPFFIAPHPVLAVAKVRYFGDPVAVVVAETLPQAMDAAERIVVAHEPLTAATSSEDALVPRASLVWEERGTNLCVDSEAGDNAATDAAFARAAHVVRLETVINRVTGVPMELRAALGVYDADATRYTVYTSAGGGVVRQRDDSAAVLGVPLAMVRVVSGDVGGNFGIRNSTCPEFALVAWAARRVGRPVKWTCERHDAFASDFHGRDLSSEAELALDRDGRFIALRAVNTPGSGTTSTLAHRVAHLVVNGADPRRVLLMTFSRRAANEMIRRVERVIRRVISQGAPRMTEALNWAGTFHAIGARLLPIYADQIGLDPAFMIHDREDSADLLNLIRHQLGFSRTEARFPTKGTCLAIYSRCVNAEMPIEEVLRTSFPWCAEWVDEL